MIQLFHVTKEYPGDGPALQDVTLEVDKGEFVFLTGPSGAGKSTLLKLVFCDEAPTSGQLLLFGKNVAKIGARAVPYLRRNIGVVFQDFKLLPQRTVAENVALPLEVQAMPEKEIRRRVKQLLRSVGLEHRAEKFPPSLSGGEQQRVAVARALAPAPALLLADEPTGNLDPERTLEVMQLLADANARGTTVLVATHDRSLLERYKRRVVLLERGRLVSDGDSIRRAPGAGAGG
ncbi:cell division ATP-binding protein FtsE [Anaeromyxobacter dehalogenans]|uniref:Cell division ATP-binding protein FtsE n=1 Tax=Anaeromyxobacter dehalogenans (strain 2CP-C) TaxID=290397 RepID=Q2INQ9_ANADE|nr:cell division ATP-binding protein FtsE [Anaeromyxobacter dehalogenans]ABC80442.1 cell division ATP-binding protein FtsE [Anaeromyxobacter dehalogenans 2CP-C]